MYHAIPHKAKCAVQTSYGRFLAALAALGLPWSLTHSLTVLAYWLCWIQSLPDQTPNLANLIRGHDKT